MPARTATGAARMKPRASRPTTFVAPCRTAELGQGVREGGERLRVGQQRGDVLEHHPGLRIVRHVADPAEQQFLHVGHRRGRRRLRRAHRLTCACPTAGRDRRLRDGGWRRCPPTPARPLAGAAAVVRGDASDPAAAPGGPRRDLVRLCAAARRPGAWRAPASSSAFICGLALLEVGDQRRGDEDRGVRAGGEADEQRRARCR